MFDHSISTTVYLQYKLVSQFNTRKTLRSGISLLVHAKQSWSQLNQVIILKELT